MDLRICPQAPSYERSFVFVARKKLERCSGIHSPTRRSARP
jgi:hypothetical protein